ncbi:MAG: hypothetical protein JEZ03_10465 [Bacteroidales bacterium]|nr:hypothetical protein [Bacteroidales bacterium]
MTERRGNPITLLLGAWVGARLDKFESILVLIFVMGLILRITMGWPVFLLIYLSLGLLSLMYLLNASAMDLGDTPEVWARILNKLASWSCSIGVLGMLFRILNYPGYDKMLMIGGIGLLIIFPFMIRLNLKSDSGPWFGHRWLIRVFLIAVLGLTLNFAPTDKLIDMGLIDHPEVEMTE